MPLFLIPPTNENYEITHERKFWTHEIPTEKIWNPRNTHEKNLNLTKYTREKIFVPRNTHEGRIAPWH